MSSNTHVAIFTCSDLSTVQGSTEAHYVASALAVKYNLDIVSPYNPRISAAEHHAISASTLIPAFFLYNFFLIPYFLYLSLKNHYDIIYTYKGFNIAPYLIASLTLLP